MPPPFVKLLMFGLTVILAVSELFGLSFSPKANRQYSFALFTLTDTPRKKAAQTSIAAERESEIKINLAQFTPQNSDTLSFPLFDGKTYQALRDETDAVDIRSIDNFTWRGRIFGAGEFRGDVVLTIEKGFVAGLIYAPGAVYEIIPRNSKQILVEINQNEFPECAGVIKPPKNDTNGLQNNQKAAVNQVDSGDRIDVLIVYTTAVKNFLGGDAQARVFAQQAADATNTAYRNSQIRQRVRLAHASELAYVETGVAAADLGNLLTNEEVAALRETYKADLVALVVNSMDGCGIGYLMNSVGTDFAPYGFTVTARSCAVGNLSLAHELGHNMGSAHNPENSDDAGFPFSYGHFVSGVFRTVMSYSEPCAGACPRVPFFSNPLISFSGYPTGVANQRDNSRSINNTADTAANFRYSGASLTLNNLNKNERIPRHIGRVIQWSSENLQGNVRIELSRDGGATYTTLIENTLNDGAEIINVYGRSTRRARLRIVSVENPQISDSSVENITIQ